MTREDGAVAGIASAIGDRNGPAVNRLIRRIECHGVMTRSGAMNGIVRSGRLAARVDVAGNDARIRRFILL